jgi:hypothetical protein
MLIFEIHVRKEGVDAGRLLCRWEEEPWLAGIRSELRQLQRNTLGEIKAVRPNFALPSDDEIERGLDEDIEKVREIAAELGTVIFGKAQAELQKEVMIRFSQQTGLFRPQDKVLVGKMRKKTSRLAQEKYHKHIGMRRGRAAGQKDVKPREVIRKTKQNRQAILAAMRAIGEEPIYRTEVAKKIGKNVKTISEWMNDITSETGEEWDDLISKALRRKSK